MEHYSLVGGNKCREVLNQYPDYRVFWRAGFAYRGAGEREDNKQPVEEYIWQERIKRETTFGERMQRRYNWAVAIDIDINHESKEIHFNGFSENDMF